MMTLEIARTNKDIHAMKKLYLESFPREERKPFWLMRKKVKTKEMEMLSIKDGDEFLGLMITIPRSDAVLLDYFAVVPEKRGGGIGERALKLFGEYYEGKTLVIEIETPKEDAPNNDERKRRERFYHRCGFSEVGVDILLFGVEMKLLTLGRPMDYDEYILFYSELFGKGIINNIKMLKTG